MFPRQVDWAMNTDRVAVIHLLASDPDLHGTGIGRCLLEKARDVARERNADVIRLDTLISLLPHLGQGLNSSMVLLLQHTPVPLKCFV